MRYLKNPMKSSIHHFLSTLFFAGTIVTLSAGLEPGDQIQLTLRGVTADEQQKVNGIYRVGETGSIRLPFLSRLLSARGLTPEQLARAAESAYKAEGIYSQPAIEVEAVQGKDQQGLAQVSVGGQVRRAGATPFQKDMTVIQALDAVGGRNEFGSRNIHLIRAGKQYCLDFNNLAHKNIVLQPGDSLQVEQKGSVIDRWKGSTEAVKPLLD